MAIFVVAMAVFDGGVGLFLNLDGLDGDVVGSEEFSFMVILEVLKTLPLDLFLGVHQ